MADISRTKPAVRCDGLRSLVRLLVISHHNRRTLDLDLAVHDTHLTAVYNTPHGRNLIRSCPVRRRNFRGTLRHAVALGNSNTEALVIGCQIRCQVSAAADDLVKPGTKHLLFYLADGHLRALPV